MFGSLVENKDEPNRGDHGCQRTDDVESVLGYFARVRDGPQRHGDSREDENDRQDEEPSPTCHVYQDSRHEHPEDATATADGGPHTDRLGTLFGWEGRGNDCEGNGHDHRCADAAEESCSEHDRCGRGQTRRRACQAKDDQARD